MNVADIVSLAANIGLTAWNAVKVWLNGNEETRAHAEAILQSALVNLQRVQTDTLADDRAAQDDARKAIEEAHKKFDTTDEVTKPVKLP